MVQGIVMDYNKRLADENQKRKERSSRAEIRFYEWNRSKGNLIRILPPGPEEGKFYVPNGGVAMPVYSHYGLDLNNPKDSVRCIQQTWPEKGQACPICTAIGDLRAYLKRSGMDDAQQRAIMGKYNLNARAYTNVISRNSNQYYDMDTGAVVEIRDSADRVGKSLAPVVYVAGLPIGVFNWLVDQISNSMFGDITNPDTGLDLLISVSGSGKQTKYDKLFPPERTPLEGSGSKQPDELMRKAVYNQMYDIGSIFTFPDQAKYDRIVALANNVRKLIGDPTAAYPKPAMDEDDLPAWGNGAGDTSGKPPCYTNHIQSANGKDPFEKCMACPCEAGCIEDSERAGRSYDDRLAVHGHKAAAATV